MATDTRHYEESNPAQVSFAQDVQSLTDIIEQMGNPFTENSSDMIILDTRDIADPARVYRQFSTPYSYGHLYR